MKLKRILQISVYGAVGLIIFSCSGNKPEAAKHTIQANNIRSYLIGAAQELTDSSLSDIKQLDDWEKIRSDRYSKFIEMMSLQDMPINGKRSDLNVRVTGVIQREGYRIEKLYYESLPGLYVPANLYVPDSIKEPVPAILYVCGHARTQKVHYQTHPAKFAQLGFVCLIIETIQWGESVVTDVIRAGLVQQGIYTTIEVEPCAGNLLSNIEYQEDSFTAFRKCRWFIAAADPRIKAVAPVCGASTLEAQISTRTIDGHCDCMMPVNTYQIDFQNIGALIAPRPLLIGQADRDGLNRVESVRRIYYDLKRLYELHGAPEKIGYVETPGGHSYHQISREKIFSFFLEHLMGKNITPQEAGDIDQSPERLLSEETLKVYIDGPPKDDRTTIIQDSFIKLAESPEVSSENEMVILRDSVRDFLSRKTFGAFPDIPPPFDSVLVFRTLDDAEFGSDVYSFVSEEGWRLNVDIRWKKDPSGKNPLMIVLRNRDENRWESEEFISNLKDDWNLAFLEVRGVGEFGWDPNLQWHVRRASAWTGRTIASMQVWDVLRCIDFCRTLRGVDPEGIGIAARDEMGAVALYSALMDGECKTLLLKNPPASQNVASSPDGRGPAIEMLNCLRVTDLYQLPALLTNTEILFIGEIPAAYKWSETTLKKLGKEGFHALP
jgi:cephalosporin-C deacetylase-like acetyl esterase